MRVEAKNVVSAKQGTGAAEQEFGELVGEEQGGGDRAEQGVGGPARDGAEDALHGSHKSVDGAEEGVFGAFLRAPVHFDPILLVLERKRHPMRVPGQEGVRVGEDMKASVAKRNVFQFECFGTAGASGFDNLARSNGKEESADDNVDGVVIIVSPDLFLCSEVGEGAEESRGEGLLTFGGVI